MLERLRFPLILEIGPARRREYGRLSKSDMYLTCDIIKGPHIGVVADAHHLPLRNESFHGVIAKEVLEHLSDPRQAVS